MQTQSGFEEQENRMLCSRLTKPATKEINEVESSRLPKVALNGMFQLDEGHLSGKSSMPSVPFSSLQICNFLKK
jgi:hypothetical protein